MNFTSHIDNIFLCLYNKPIITIGFLLLLLERENTLEHQKLYIEGMTCINCQTRIQNALNQLPGITQAAVSYETGTADISYDTSVISLEQIQNQIDTLGYHASVGKSSRTRTVLQILRKLGLITVLYFLLQHFGILNYLAPSSLADTQMSYGMLFVIGLLTSVHCIAMCGGINLSQTLRREPTVSADISRAMLLNAAAYNAGRVISYTLIGAVLGAVGALTGMAGALQTSSFFQGLFKLLAGALMVVMGINMLGLFPGLRRIPLHLPLQRFRLLFQKGKLTEQTGFPRRSTPFIVGLCNGLMPCGPLQSMQIVALASANVLTGALSMFFFALGTVPLMLGFGSVISALGKRFTEQVLTCGAILVVVMGLSMMSQGTALSGISSKITCLFSDKADAIASNSNLNAASYSGSDTDYAIEKDGIQYLSSTLESGRYPDITVKAGIPVNWTIHADNNSINGCNYKILLQDFNTEYVFQKGDNTIEFTPQKTGVYTYSCWMGMITGKIYVENE